jgi:hypothetical protein
MTTDVYRQLNDNDLLSYLQENQALLKTILFMLEKQSENPEVTQQENVIKYREFLEDTKFVFSVNTLIK